MTKFRFYPARFVLFILGIFITTIILLSLFGIDTSENIISWLLNKLILFIILILGIIFIYYNKDVIINDKDIK